VSDPRFRPRNYVQGSGAFGGYGEVDWIVPRSDDEADRLSAAQMQDRLARQIRRSAAAQYGSVRAYADNHGLSYDRLTKLLRGETLMRLEDSRPSRPSSRRNPGMTTKRHEQMTKFAPVS
jgi:hypothetical protein